ncbi:hypothetical protein [Paeniglutamicibacter kerguelensis]|uniref:Lipoprotein n=1 Tax=Paeniglutamicibacter kerguelensis TaxID=254788 RepID=A0ABS4XIK8_9MICC|nr:hypothetical protein [Paeniglutamicibacter kerguelensis]MBP2388088.1 hypothetical protein [Paeniglutamicibacter kerguelensis]
MALRRGLGIVLAMAFCVMLGACSTGKALRVEVPSVGSSPSATATKQRTISPEEAEAWEKPFTPAQIRSLLLNTDLSGLRADGADPAEIHEYLSTCARCVIALPSHEAAGERFQVFSVSTAGDSYSFASFVVRNDAGTPRIVLAVGGSDIYLTSGSDGSLVAQEAIYEPQDPMCCPSGWSVRLFRYQDGRFIEGDTFESPVDYAEPEGEK